jgi:hypothetical protein
MGILQLGVLMEIRDFDIQNTLLFQYKYTGHQLIWPLSVSVGLLTWINAGNEIWLFESIKISLWGFSKFEFRPMELFQYQGLCSLNNEVEAGEKTKWSRWQIEVS